MRLLSLLVRQGRLIRRLQRIVDQQNIALERAYRQRDQYRRDVLLLVECARDRKVAVEFVQAAHDIDKWGVTR